jgi:glycosyltransferase involved in cell wall biosynthesis
VRQPDAVATLRAYDLFFMPTRGENFGYALVEALIAGCPLLTSDQTPWTDLESKGVGWDLPLSSPAAFTSVLQRCVDMGAEEHGAMSERAAELGREAQHQSDRTNRDQYRSMFFAVARSAGWNPPPTQ